MNVKQMKNRPFKALCHDSGSFKTFANKKQAENAARETGGEVWQSPLSKVRFVIFR
jgi:hypothetical protein